jgi:hypothetical protein
MAMAYPAVLSVVQTEWGLAFSALGVGGVLGLLSMLWLRTMPEARRLAGGKR